MEQIYERIYRIEVPLPDSPLKELNAYLIMGVDRNLLVDTGFNHQICIQALLEAFSQVGVKPENTDVFLTHTHSDHCGLVCKLQRESNTVYMSEEDGDYLNSLQTLDYDRKLQSDSKLFDLPPAKLLSYNSHPGNYHKPDAAIKIHPVKDGDTIQVGRYLLRVVDLAGHTPGQIGLWEEEHRLLFSGDHILGKITPNIVVWKNEMDSIATFMKNLHKTAAMNLAMILPGHRSLILDPDKRIAELIRHHIRRLDEILRILKNGEGTVNEITNEMHWDFAGGNAASFPPTQLWFASSEAYAHLEHLRQRGYLARVLRDHHFYYSLTGNACYYLEEKGSKCYEQRVLNRRGNEPLRQTY